MKHALHVAGMLLLALTLLIQGSTPAVYAQQPINLDSPGAARTVGQPVGSIPAGTAQWFQFDYSFTPSQRPRPTVTVRLLNGVQNKLQFEVWSPERLQGTWSDNEPVGRGMPEIIAGCFWKLSDGSIAKCTTDHLFWVGGFGALGTYYIRVVNTSDVAVAPQVIVSGPGLGQCVNPSGSSIPQPISASGSADGYVQVQCEFPPEIPTRSIQVLAGTPTLVAVATPPATLGPPPATTPSTATPAPSAVSTSTVAATQTVIPTTVPAIAPTATAVATAVPGGATTGVPTATLITAAAPTGTAVRPATAAVLPATATSPAQASPTAVAAGTTRTSAPAATATPRATEAPRTTGTAAPPPATSVPSPTSVSGPTQVSRATGVVISSPTAPPPPTATVPTEVTVPAKVVPSATSGPSATVTIAPTATTVPTQVPTPTASPVPTPIASPSVGTSAPNQVILDITISSAGYLSIGGFDTRALGLQPLDQQANQFAKQLENAHLVVQNDLVTVDVHSTPLVKMQWGPSSRQVVTDLATRYGVVVNPHALVRLEEWISSSNIDVTARYTDEPSKAVRASLTKPLWIDIGSEGQLTIEQVPLAMNLDPAFMQTVKQSGYRNVLLCWNKGTLKIKADGKDLPVLMLDANGVGAVSRLLGLRIENSLDPLFQSRFGLDISLGGAAHQANASCSD